MDLQVICEVTSASRYILGYAFKSEEDFAAARRMEAIVEQLTALTAGSNLNQGSSHGAAGPDHVPVSRLATSSWASQSHSELAKDGVGRRKLVEVAGEDQVEPSKRHVGYVPRKA